jgi:hypothetical protein
MAASAVLFLFNVIEKKLPRANPTQEFSHSLGTKRTFNELTMPVKCRFELFADGRV